MATLLEVRDLRTYFYTRAGLVKAVDGISYDVEEGETVALVGESGCGKSVSALSILRLIPDPPGKIVGGTVVWEGQQLLKLTAEEVRRLRGKGIAMVFQEPMTSLNPVLTIGRQITECLKLHQNLSKAPALDECVRLLRALGISEAERRVNQYPHLLSGGMRQRVMLAMALGCNPKLLIADEPTTAVDVTIQAQLLDIMNRLTKEKGVALVLITHNLGIVARYVQRVNVMYAGRIVEKAPTKELYAHPRHPYTIALLESVPRLDEERKERLVSIEGQPPSLIDLPSGCSFRPRCPYVVHRCWDERPDLVPVSDNHFSACWVMSER